MDNPTRGMHMSFLSLCLSVCLLVCLSIHPSTIASIWSIGHPWNVSFLFSFLNLVGSTPSTGDQPVARPLSNTNKNKRKQTSMPWVEFEPTIPVLERSKIFHALECLRPRGRFKPSFIEFIREMKVKLEIKKTELKTKFLYMYSYVYV
jgi:hypothetical protein